MKFAELDLHPKIKDNLSKVNFVDCTPIQEQAIPHLLQGKDIAGLAQTGTGKTAAFLVPLIDRILRSKETPDHSRCFPEWKKRNCLLILVPTRELADQVYENAVMLTGGMELGAVAIYGGTTYERQKAALRDGVELVIATPGRLIDLYKEHCFDMGQVRAVVFDEADRMFDMGFKDDMKFILRRIPRERQFLVFSATLNFDVLNVAYEFGADPVEINISRDQAKAEHVKDEIFHVGQDDKAAYLLSILKKKEPRQAIIFSNFKRNVERITQFLSRNGFPAMGISSLLTQGQRNRVMAQFKAENDRNILVATDLAARGLDILGVDMIVNFELPDDPENYVHRIGRTGRAGAEGTAFSLVSDRDVEALGRIESYLKHKVNTAWFDDADIVTSFAPFPKEDFSSRGDRPSRPMDRGPRRGPPHKRPHGQRRHEGRPHEGRPHEGRPHEARHHESRPPGERKHPEHRQREEGRGEGQSAHRDRRMGRHGSPQTEERQQQEGSGRHGGGQHRHEHGRRPQRGAHRRPQGNGHDKRRHHGSGQASTRPQGEKAASQGIGSKVSGFIKRLFGQKKKNPKSSTRSS